MKDIPEIFPIEIDMTNVSTIVDSVHAPFYNSSIEMNMGVRLQCQDCDCITCVARVGDTAYCILQPARVSREDVLRWLIDNREYWEEV